MVTKCNKKLFAHAHMHSHHHPHGENSDCRNIFDASVHSVFYPTKIVAQT
jgi:hypothetical protein